jgi:hypothetical protein
MIIARGSDKDGEFLLLGLSRENIKRLTEGQPIRMTRKSHGDGGPEGWTIVVMHVETKQAMKRTLEVAGLVKPEMPVHIDERLKNP